MRTSICSRLCIQWNSRPFAKFTLNCDTLTFSPRISSKPAVFLSFVTLQIRWSHIIARFSPTATTTLYSHAEVSQALCQQSRRSNVSAIGCHTNDLKALGKYTIESCVCVCVRERPTTTHIAHPSRWSEIHLTLASADSVDVVIFGLHEISFNTRKYHVTNIRHSIVYSHVA